MNTENKTKQTGWLNSKLNATVSSVKVIRGADSSNNFSDTHIPINYILEIQPPYAITSDESQTREHMLSLHTTADSTCHAHWPKTKQLWEQSVPLIVLRIAYRQKYSYTTLKKKINTFFH